MAKITFDQHRHAYITIDTAVKEISFLMSPIFDNSDSNLLRDIDLCDNEDMKRILVGFYEYIKSFNQEEENEILKDELSLEFEAGVAGDWCAVVHNITAEHSGYWYAAQNLEEEKKSLIRLRHELEGLKIAVENIDDVISSIRNAVSTEDAIAKIIAFGMDEQQANAIMRMRLSILTGYDVSAISDMIVEYKRWEEFIQNNK